MEVAAGAGALGTVGVLGAAVATRAAGEGRLPPHREPDGGEARAGPATFGGGRP